MMKEWDRDWWVMMMKVENGKIIEATENELFENYLKLGFDDIFDFNTYKRRCEASGVKIIEESEENEKI